MRGSRRSKPSLIWDRRELTTLGLSREGWRILTLTLTLTLTLIGRLEDPEPYVRASACRTLVAIGNQLNQISEIHNSRSLHAGQRPPPQGYNPLCHPYIEPIANRLESKDIEPSVRVAALKALAQIGRPAILKIELMSESLKDEDAHVRLCAVEVLLCLSHKTLNRKT